MKVFGLFLLIFVALYFYFRFSPIGRVRKRILLNYVKGHRKKFILIFLSILLCPFGVYKLYNLCFPDSSFETKTDYQNYSLNLLQSGALSKDLILEDSTVHFCPELVSIVPTVLKTLEEISKKKIVPILRVQGEKQIYFQIKGFKTFKNRGTRTEKRLKKLLGKKYLIDFSETSHGAFLAISYKGEPWKQDEILSLPAALYAKKYGVAPEHVLSFWAALYPVDSVNLLNRFSPDSVAKLLHQANTGKDDSTLFAYAIRNAMPTFANDSGLISVYTISALEFAAYFRKYGMQIKEPTLFSEESNSSEP